MLLVWPSAGGRDQSTDCLLRSCLHLRVEDSFVTTAKAGIDLAGAIAFRDAVAGRESLVWVAGGCFQHVADRAEDFGEVGHQIFTESSTHFLEWHLRHSKLVASPSEIPASVLEPERSP